MCKMNWEFFITGFVFWFYYVILFVLKKRQFDNLPYWGKTLIEESKKRKKRK